MRRILFALLPIVALGFAPAPVYRERLIDPEAVLRRFQGGWRGISYKRDRVIMPGAFRVQVEKDNWRFFVGNPGRAFEQSNAYTIALDTKSNPMRIEWKSGGTRLQGIFQLSGDKLHYTYRMADAGYPPSLAAPTAEDYVIELEREK